MQSQVPVWRAALLSLAILTLFLGVREIAVRPSGVSGPALDPEYAALLGQAAAQGQQTPIPAPSAIARRLFELLSDPFHQRGTNDQEILPMARHFRHSGNVLRFIEYMDVGATNGWRMGEVLASSKVIERINAAFPVAAIDANYLGETAERWRYADGGGEIGVISSVTQAFCSDCNRARLSTEGKLFLCLFASQGHDLRALLRGDFNDEQISNAVGNIWHKRDDRYSELRAAMPADTQIGDGEKRVEMSYIGG